MLSRLDRIRQFGREQHASPVQPRPPRSDTPQGRAHAARVALNGLRGDMLVKVVYSIVADHEGLTPEQMHALSNRIGRAADERERLTRGSE